MPFDPLPFVVLALVSVALLGSVAPALLAPLAGVRALLRARYRSTPARCVEEDAVPHAERLLLDATGEALAMLGFDMGPWLETSASAVGDPVGRVFVRTAWHPEHATTAVATIGVVPNGIPVQVAFVTVFGDGSAVRTVNRLRWMLPPQRPGQTMEDPCCDDLDAQWEAHRQAVTGHQGAIAERSEALRHLMRESSGEAAYAHLTAIGWMREVSPGRWRHTLMGALRQARRVLVLPARVRAALGRSWRQNPAPDPAGVELAALKQTSATLALTAAEGIPLGRAAAAVALGVALVAFSPAPPLVAFGAALAALVAVGLHLLAKRLAARSIGLSGPAAAIMPLVDALARGERRMPSATRQAAALLVVPCVEILIGSAVLAGVPAALESASIDAAARTLGWTLLALGAMDLLPLRACAGLRLLELGLLSRAPRVLPLLVAAALALAVLPMIAFGVLGVGALLAPLAVLTLLALVWVRRSACGLRLADLVRETIGPPAQAPMSASGALTAVAFELSNGVVGDGSLPGSGRARFHAIAAAYASLVDGPPPPARAVVLLATHGLAMALAAGTLAGAALPSLAPLAAVFGSSHPGDRASARADASTGGADPIMASRAEQPQRLDPRSAFRLRFDEESDPATRWAMLESSEARSVMRGDDPIDGIWLASNREHLLPLLPDEHPARVAAEREGRLVAGSDPVMAQHLLLRRATLSSDPDVVRGSLRRVFVAVSDLRPCHGDRLIGGVVIAYDRLQRGFPAALTPEDHAAVVRLLDAVLAPGCRDPMGAGQVPLLASAVARAFLAGGRRAQADETMARLAAAEATQSGRHDGLVQAWYLLEKGDAAAAIGATRAGLAALPPGSSEPRLAAVPEGPGAVVRHARQQWHAVGGWAELALGRPDRADEHFREAFELDARTLEGAAGSGSAGAKQGRGPATVPGDRGIRPTAWAMDRLIALRAHDPGAAERLRAGLLRHVTAQHGALRIEEESAMPYGWGARRAQMHRRLRDELRAEAKAIIEGSGAEPSAR